MLDPFLQIVVDCFRLLAVLLNMNNAALKGLRKLHAASGCQIVTDPLAGEFVVVGRDNNERGRCKTLEGAKELLLLVIEGKVA